MNKKEYVINSKISSNKTSYKYFQPILTNNTQVVSAKTESDESDINTTAEDIFDSKKVYKFKVNLSDVTKADDVKVSKTKEKNTDVKNSKTQEKTSEEKVSEVREKIIEEKANEEKVSETLEKIIKENDSESIENNVEEEANENIEEKIDRTVSKMLSELKLTEDDIPSKEAEKMKISEDLTSKMDLPLSAIKNNEESVPFRREAPDDIKEFKVKLFLLAANAKKPVRIMVNRKKFLIGSDFEKMDCVIRNNRYISRCHARIYYESECYFIEDAGSMNGTYINGVKLAEGLKYKLMTGDIINLADCKFEVSMK